MQISPNQNESFEQLISRLTSGDEIVLESMDMLAENLRQLKQRIDEILNLNCLVIFKSEGLTFSNSCNQEQEILRSCFRALCTFEQKNWAKRRRLGIEKAKEMGKYSKERSKKISSDLREELLKERDLGVPVAKIIKKYQISRKTFYNYTQYATKNILKNINSMLTQELIKK